MYHMKIGTEKSDVMSPQLPKALISVEHFSSYAQEFLTDEMQISQIKCDDETAEDADFHKIEIQKSIFKNCCFRNCDFEHASFMDVVFQSCDLSNSKFTGSYFERCQFVSCKCMGIRMNDTVIKHTAFEDSNLQYSIFDETKISHVLFDHIDFTESSMAQAKLKKFEAAGSKFIKNNFFKTLLNTVDFSDNELAAPIVSDPPIELKGAAINLFQAADLIRLWGIIVK